jgi:triosephosphate isomerase
MSKDPIVIGNWKMYKMAREAMDYIEELALHIQSSEARVFLAVPFTAIALAATSAKPTKILIGAQNMNDAREGAFTGEIAAIMLKEAGARFVLLGHSERRQIFGEGDEMIERKVIRALEDDLIPVLCVGETAKERKEGKCEEVLKRQITTALQHVPQERTKELILAYEPVWAIGTGKTATPELAEEAHKICRECLVELFGKRKAGQIPILYGGSVKPENVHELVAEKNIDGVLVGGASLDPKTFAAIINHCTR